MELAYILVLETRFWEFDSPLAHLRDCSSMAERSPHKRRDFGSNPFSPIYGEVA